MDGLIPTLSLGSEQVIRLVVIVVAVIVTLFILKFVVNVAVSVFRSAMWIGALLIIIYIAISLIR